MQRKACEPSPTGWDRLEHKGRPKGLFRFFRDGTDFSCLQYTTNRDRFRLFECNRTIEAREVIILNYRLALLALGTFALGTDGFVIAGILPVIAHSLAVSVAQAGQLISVFALIYAVGGPVLATLTGKVTRRRLLLSALVVFALANGWAAVSPDYWSLLAARMVAAAGAALYTPTAAAMAAAMAAPEKRGRALALVAAGLSTATVLGVPLGTWIGFSWGWRYTFALVAILAVVAGLGILAFLPEVAAAKPVDLRTRLSSLGRPAILTGLVFVVLSFTGGFTVYTYIALLLHSLTHLGGGGISIVLLVFGLAGMAGTWLGGHGTDTWGPVPILAAGSGLLVVVFLTMPWTFVWLPGAVVATAVWGIAGWTIPPAQQHRLIALMPENPGVVLSLNASALYVGIGLGAVLGSLVIRYVHQPLPDLAWASMGCEILAVGVLALWRKPLGATQ